MDSGLANSRPMIFSSKHFLETLMAVLSLTLLYDVKVRCQHRWYLLARSVGLALNSLREEIIVLILHVLFTLGQ